MYRPRRRVPRRHRLPHTQRARELRGHLEAGAGARLVVDPADVLPVRDSVGNVWKEVALGVGVYCRRILLMHLP